MAKKIKQTLALVLTLVLCVNLVALPVRAETGTVTETVEGVQVEGSYTFEQKEDGSYTYEDNLTGSADTDNDGIDDKTVTDWETETGTTSEVNASGGTDVTTTTTDQLPTETDQVLIDGTPEETPTDLGEGTLNEEKSGTEGPTTTSGEVTTTGDENHETVEDTDTWTATGDATTTPVENGEVTTTPGTETTIDILPKDPVVNENGETVTNPDSLEFEAPEQVVTQVTQDGESIIVNPEYVGEEPGRRYEYVGIEIGGKVLVTEGAHNNAYIVAGEYIAEFEKDADGNVVTNPDGSKRLNATVSEDGDVSIHLDLEYHHGFSGPSSKTITVTSEQFKAIGVQGTVQDVNLSMASVNSMDDQYDSLILRVQSLTSVLPGGEIITYDIRDGAAVVREHTIPVTEEMIIPEEYRDETKYDITEKDGVYTITSKAPTTSNSDPVTGEATKTDSVSNTWTEQVANDEWEAKFTAAGENATTVDATDADGNPTEITSFVNADGQTVTKTTTLVQQYDAQGNKLYLDADGNQTTEVTSTPFMQQGAPTYTVTSVVKGDVETSYTDVAYTLTPEEIAALPVPADTVTYEEPVLPGNISSLMVGGTISDVVDPATGNTTTYSGYNNVVELKDSNGNVTGKYIEVVIETKDANGKVIARDTVKVFGDKVSTAYTVIYDEVEKRVYTYSQTTTETIETTFFEKTSTYESNTWEREVTSENYESKEVITITKDDPTAPDTYLFRGTMYAVQDLNENDSISYSNVKTTGITLNSKADANSYNADVTVEIKDAFLSRDQIAVVKDAKGNVIGKYRLAENGQSGVTDFITGTTTATVNTANGTTSFILEGMKLENGADVVIELCNPKNGTVVANLGGTDEVAEKFDAVLKVKMNYVVSAPSYTMTSSTQTTHVSTTAQSETLTKSQTTEQTDKTYMKTTNIYEASDSSLQVIGDVTVTETTETLAQTRWTSSYEIPPETPPQQDPPPKQTKTAEVPTPDPDPEVFFGFDEAAGEAIILDEEVPLADAPFTGDISGLWAIVSVLSLGGAAYLSRKREEDEV